jgi:hypothetical protein
MMLNVPHRLLIVLLTALVMTAGCGDDETPTTPTDTTEARANETFSGTIRVGQSQFYSFSTVSPGTTEVTLVSLRPVGSQTATVNPTVGLGLGTPQGLDCALSSATTATPALKAQITASTNISVYCVKIADLGNLTGSLDYTIRILHP